MEKNKAVPVIVVAAGKRLDDAVEAVHASGGTVRHVLARLNAVAAWVPPGAIEWLSQREPIEEVELDQPVRTPEPLGPLSVARGPITDPV